MENVSEKSKSENKTIDEVSVSSLKEQAVFLADILFKRKYIFKGEKLAGQYWNDNRYKKDFQLYIIKCMAWLKIYPVKVIYNILHTPKGLKTWSWNCPWLKTDLEKELVKLKEQDRLKSEKVKIEIVKDETIPVYRKNNKTENRLDKLD